MIRAEQPQLNLALRTQKELPMTPQLEEQELPVIQKLPASGRCMMCLGVTAAKELFQGWPVSCKLSPNCDIIHIGSILSAGQ